LAAFDRMAAAARREARLQLSITSAFRSDAEQARLFAANHDPKWVAPPGPSLHRYATELDLGPPAAYAWLAANARRFGFIHRYRWEAWHEELPSRKLLRPVARLRAVASVAYC
jgi:LAS superfamily LD-carboxypeptidase LdcB